MTEVHSPTCTWELEILINELKSTYDSDKIQRELSLLDAHGRQHIEDEFAYFDQQFSKE